MTIAGLDTSVKTVQSELLRSTCPWLKHGVSTRLDGHSIGAYASRNLGLHVGDDPLHVLANRRAFLSEFEDAGSGAALALAERVIVPEQSHGSRVVRVSTSDIGKGSALAATAVEGTDGLATDEPGVPLLTLYADCVPILIVDPIKHTVCAVHAGWRGTAARIALEAVRLLKSSFRARASDLVTWIGPSIGACCYEVSQSVAEAVSSATGAAVLGGKGLSSREGSRSLDLKLANRIQLESVGVNGGRIEVSPHCTACRGDLFYSFRRDGATGRMGMFAMIDAQREGCK